MAIFMEFEGIEGDATAPGHEGWITCDSMSWGISRMINTLVGTGAERESSTPNVTDVNLTTQMDKASPLFAKAAAVSTGKEVKIHLVQTGESQPEPYMEYILTEVLITGYDVHAGGDGVPSESLSLNFTKIEMKYSIFDDSNNPAGNVLASYDLKTGQPG